jgi:F-type H+-transporting ATPase subunit delta
MSRASFRYAKALLEQAVAKGCAEQVNHEMNSIQSAVAESRDFAAFLKSPVIKLDDKQAVVFKVFSGCNEITASLFKLLYENKRFELLGDIAKDYLSQFLEMNHYQKVQVTTAAPLDKDLENKVLDKVRTFTDKKLILENIVNPDIIGGFILRLGDKQFNASVAAKLKSIKKEFTLS